MSTKKQISTNTEHYSALDGLRAYAALGIVLMHVLVNITIKPSTGYITERLIPFFTNFTLLFMMISGFSLCCGYYTRIKDGTITPNVFYRKRYLRVLPFFTLLCIINLIIEHDLGSFCEAFANMTLCFGLLPPDFKFHVIGVGWFLGIVFLFYMLFPFFVFMLDNKRRAWISFALSLIFVLASFLHFGAPGRRCMIFCAPLFIAGGIVYMYRLKIANFERRHILLSSVGVIVLTVCYFGFNGFVHGKFIHYILDLLLFALWLIYAIGSKDMVLNNKVVKYLSGISMEIYLSHMVIYRVVEKVHLENFISQHDVLYIVTALLTIVGVVCFAHVMKYYVVNKVIDRIEKVKNPSSL